MLFLLFAFDLFSARAMGSDAGVLLDLLTTRDTELISSDGKNRVVRKLDRDGVPTSVIASGIRDGIPFRLEWVADGGRREWRYFEAGKLISTWVEEHSAPGRLASRERRSGPAADGELTRRELTRYLPRGAEKIVSVRREREWKTAGPVSVETELEDGLGAPGDAKWNEYLSCRKAGNDSSGVCLTTLKSAEASFVAQPTLDIQSVLPPRCQDDCHVFTGNGYRIDRESCAAGPGADAAREGRRIATFEKATKLVTGELLSCLNELNPAYATQFAVALVTRQPRLQCIGTEPGAKRVLLNWCRGRCAKESDPPAPGEDACREEFGPKVMRGRSHFQEKFPDDIQLAPFLAPNSKYGDPESPGYLYRQDGTGDDFAQSVASMVFHESLHLAGHSGYHDHNKPALSHVDDVYGCQSICSARKLPKMASFRSPAQLIYATRESCLACMRTRFLSPADDDEGPEKDPARVEPGDKPGTARETELCGGYPPVSRMEEFVKVLTRTHNAKRCQMLIRNSVGLNPKSDALAEYRAVTAGLGTPTAGLQTLWPPCKWLEVSTDLDAACKTATEKDPERFMKCLDAKTLEWEGAFRMQAAAMGKDFPALAPSLQTYERTRREFRKHWYLDY